MCAMHYFHSYEITHGLLCCYIVVFCCNILNDKFVCLFFYRIVNVSSRAGMLDTIKNSKIREDLIASHATIESVSDILSDFIK